jgi:hypothetical protein
MIGGEDVVIPLHSTGRAEALESAVRSLSSYWDSAVFEDAITGQRYDTFSAIPFGRCHELLVYRDEAALQEWEALGATPSTEGTMVHFIAEKAAVTLVVDDTRDAMTAAVIDEIRSLLTYGVPWRMAA